MPRTSAASLSVASINTTERRVKPPDNLPGPAKKIWSGLVDSLPADRFHSSDRPLLALYCRFVHQAEMALASVEKDGAADGGATNPWLRVADVASKQCAVLATKLRLCPQTRMDRKVAGPAARSNRSRRKPWETTGTGDDEA
jgi:P27 family predicted phage terminase small subunit